MADEFDPTPAEAANGWTRDGLRAYRLEREKSAGERIEWNGRPKKRRSWQTQYSPLRWGSRGLIDRS
jgi:hypothetical protein